MYLPKNEDIKPHRSFIILPFERIARGLSELNDDHEAFRRWLNTPNPELSGFRRFRLLKKGRLRRSPIWCQRRFSDNPVERRSNRSVNGPMSSRKYRF